MKKIIVVLWATFMFAVLLSLFGLAHADHGVVPLGKQNIAPGTSQAVLQACTYNPPTLHGGQTYTVWSGNQGELVKVTNYIQRITSPDCGTSVRAATNWTCTKNGVAANCGAELGHYVEDGAGSDYAITPYTCYTSGYPCFSSSGADGIYTTYSAWFAPWFSADFRGRVSVSQVSVAGRVSGANHVSQSGWLYVP